MKRTVAWFAVLACVAVACSSAGTETTVPTVGSSPPSSAGDPTTMAPDAVGPVGGTIRTWFPAGSQTINPFLDVLENGSFWGPAVVGNVVNGVWQFHGDTGEIVPDLITEMPSVANGGLVENSDGSLTVRYEIHPDAVWSDGVPVTAADFAFTHEEMIDLLDRIDARSVEVETCGENIAVETTLGVDHHRRVVPGSVQAEGTTFTYRLTQPGDYSESLFRYVLPAHAVEGTDLVYDWVDTLWPSAGPFVVESFDRAAGRLVLVRNENYWRTDPDTGASLPRLDRVILDPAIDEIAERLDGPFPWVDEECLIFDDDFYGPAESVAEQLLLDGVIVDLYAPLPDRAVRLQEAGVDVELVTSSVIWEHIGFIYGDARLRANPDSLVEHLEFRRAIAHALDKDRIAAEAPDLPARPIDGIIEVFSPQLEVPGGDPYPYDPGRARELVEQLCEGLDRDCASDPPRVRFSYDPRPARQQLAEMVVGMLGDVGIEVDDDPRPGPDLFGANCRGSEMWTFAWVSSASFDRFAGAYDVLDPASPPAPAGRFLERPENTYAWGTDAVEGVEIEDDPNTECVDADVVNQGPSAVRNEFTQRYGRLLDELRVTVDPDEQLGLVNELESILADRAVLIPLYIRPIAHAYRSDLIGGYGYLAHPDLNPGAYWNLEYWYVKSPQPGV